MTEEAVEKDGCVVVGYEIGMAEEIGSVVYLQLKIAGGTTTYAYLFPAGKAGKLGRQLIEAAELAAAGRDQ